MFLAFECSRQYMWRLSVRTQKNQHIGILGIKSSGQSACLEGKEHVHARKCHGCIQGWNRSNSKARFQQGVSIAFKKSFLREETHTWATQPLRSTFESRRDCPGSGRGLISVPYFGANQWIPKNTFSARPDGWSRSRLLKHQPWRCCGSDPSASL
jgi:hypothetical protein